VDVPSNRSVEVNLVITEKDVNIPWSAEVEISGQFAIWFTKRWNDHYLWFLPVTHLVEMNPNFRRVGSTLRYTVRGSFSGVYSTAAHLTVKEYELKQTPFQKEIDFIH